MCAHITLAHKLGSEAEVNEIMTQARDAGAKIVKPASVTFWGGYAGYVKDPDGDLWEVGFNPEMPFSK